jgi:hypothetical protein
VTGTEAEAGPAVAVTHAVPATVEVNCAVARPFAVVRPEAGRSAPREVAKATGVPSSTGFVHWSVTVAVSVERLPTGRVSGTATRVSADGGPGTTWTVAVA